MSGIPTWDKIASPLASTTTEFGGNWANLISDYYNGTNIALTDPTKIPLIGSLTRYKFEKLSLLDVDASHSIVFSVDDIDTGTNRKIRFRRMNTPYEEDFAVLERVPQQIYSKTIDGDLNTITNIENADIKTTAAIATTKLADSANFLLKTLDNSFGAHYYDITKMTVPGNPSANDIRVYVDTADTHLKIKNNAGTVVDLHTGGGGGATNLNALTDVDTVTTAPTNNQVLTYSTGSSQWIPATPPGASGGEANTASNIGTGEGTIFSTKTGVDLKFKSLKQGNNITLTNNANDITIASNISGSGSLKSGSILKSGNATAPTTQFTIAHGYGSLPASAIVLPSSTDAMGSYITDIDSTNITITYASPPPTGTNNLEYFWLVSAASIVEGSGGAGTVTPSSVDTFTNKTYDADATGNVLSNVDDGNIKAGAAIATTKLADSSNFILKTLNNDFGAHYLDIQRMTAPGNPSANYGRIFIEQEDTNNDTAYMLIKKNGSFQKVFIA